MKKLLLSSVVLLMFSVSMFLFQVSCKKDAVAETATVTSYQPLGIILFEKSSRTTSATGSQTWAYQFFTANYDGSNQHQIPVTIPAGVSYYGNNAHLSPDGKKIFIYAYEVVSQNLTTNDIHYKDHIYSCNLDGTGFADLIADDISTKNGISSQSPYSISSVDGAY
jgi:hypothetical protein